MKAFKFIAIGGKTFWFNLNESKSGTHYITIVTKRGNDADTEKVTLFPNQIPSFMHLLLQTYAEVCKREGILNYLTLPFAVGEELEPVVPSLSEPEEPEVPECPVCNMKPGSWYDDRGLDAIGAIHVFITAETGSYLLLKCQGCSWAPEDSEIRTEGTNKGYGLYHRNTPGYDLWMPWAR